ncbi:acyltransferase [Actinoplanes sp. NBC_00393]|uniref:acyltransferase family protein n=1 Tax=Actinoplanes sp. NBC_00393 TaxID=2975953 RepID=UPI002E24C17D
MPINKPPGETTVRIPRPQTGSRMAFLDGLRLIAALVVVLYHYTAFTGVKDAWGVPSATYAFPELSGLTSYGWLGVELFFLISGFVICMSAWGRSTGAFGRSRIVRLFPAYWAAVLITAVVTTIWSAPRSLQANWSDVLVNLTMVHQPLGAPHVDGVYWTLWAEARFYLLFAFMVWWGLTARRVMVFGYAWLIISVYSVGAKMPILTTIFMPDYAPFFVGGIAFFLIHKFGSDLKFWGLVGFSWLIAQHNTYEMVARVSKTLPQPIRSGVGVALITLFYLLMAGVALGWFKRINWRWLTTAGLLTYPLYLLHEKIGWVLIYQLKDMRPRWLVLGIVVAIMLIASYLLHKVVEKPLARILKAKLAPPTPDSDRTEATVPQQPPSSSRPTPAPPQEHLVRT